MFDEGLTVWVGEEFSDFELPESNLVTVIRGKGNEGEAAEHRKPLFRSFALSAFVVEGAL